MPGGPKLEMNTAAKEATMHTFLRFLWLAGFVSASFFLPRKLKYCENLSCLSSSRQIFLVHSVYAVGVVLLFVAITFIFSAELVSGHSGVTFTIFAVFLGGTYGAAAFAPLS
jgi:hypothetical protein